MINFLNQSSTFSLYDTIYNYTPTWDGEAVYYYMQQINQDSQVISQEDFEALFN